MRLGEEGWGFVEELIEHYTDGSSLCTSWQQEFFESFSEKASDYEEETYVTEKQLAQLNKIAEIFGMEPLEIDDVE